MEYLLTGFTHDKDFRVFSFESVGADKVWTKRTVRADLSIARKHGIALQELPLLCRGLLDRDQLMVDNLTLTESDIQSLADDRATARAAAVAKRKPPVRPAAGEQQPGAAWREQSTLPRHDGGFE